jgi:hypothetical protein
MMAAKRIKGSVLLLAAVASFIATLAGVSFLTFVSLLGGQVDREINDSQSLSRNRRSGDEVAPQNVPHRESFADFLYLSNIERDPLRHDIVRFLTPDTLDARVHSNDTIWIENAPNDRPRFMGRVTNTPYCILPHGNHARFDEGFGYRLAIPFPESAQSIRDYSGYNWGTGGQDSLTQIAFSGNNIFYRKCGKIRINGVDMIHCDPSSLGSQYVPIPPSGAIFINGKVWISASRGRVDRMDGAYPESLFNDGDFISQGFSGMLSIGSSETMIIVDDLIYQHAKADNSVPTTIDSCADILGLVSENYVMVGRHVRDTVYIDAGIAALRGAFSVQDIYWSLPPDWDNEKDALLVWGSIAQRCHGLIHTHLPNYHQRGFISKHYCSDVRFANNRPIYFPEVRLNRQNRMLYMLDQGDEG